MQSFAADRPAAKQGRPAANVITILKMISLAAYQVNPATAGVGSECSGRHLHPTPAAPEHRRSRPPSTPGNASDLVDDLLRRACCAAARERMTCIAPLGRAGSIALGERHMREPRAAGKLRRGLDPLAQARKLAPCSSPSFTS